jgi:hypothetical protein
MQGVVEEGATGQTDVLLSWMLGLETPPSLTGVTTLIVKLPRGVV